MKICTPGAILREWSAEDIDSLSHYANNPRIAENMRDGFHYPYSYDDAARFITAINNQRKNLFLAIDSDGEAIGGIGIHPLDDVYRCTAEIGYWLAEPFWGKGIITGAVQALVPVAFELLPLERIQAGVFSTNHASMRVLEKSGFIREAIHRRAIYKNGQILDEILYVHFRSHAGKPTIG